MADFEADKEREEALKICQHFLLSSPPGQFHEVLTDVRKLINEGVMSEALETGIARVYNTKNGKVVTAPSGAKVALSTAGEVDATHYVDSTTGSVFAIDHLTIVRESQFCVAMPFLGL
jgi:capping protein alpha